MTAVQLYPFNASNEFSSFWSICHAKLQLFIIKKWIERVDRLMDQRQATLNIRLEVFYQNIGCVTSTELFRK